MILHCIRHGLTASNLAGRINLDDDGLVDRQVRALKTISFQGTYDRIYVSPLRRCVETAELLGLRGCSGEPRIVERRLGVFQGLSSAECVTLHPEPFAHFSRLDSDYVIPGGESRGQHLQRASGWLEEISRLSSARVLAITHGGVIDFLYRLGSGLPIHGGERIFAGENAALSEFEIAWPLVRLRAFSEALEDLFPDARG